MHTNYHGIDVYKLDRWMQGPAMLQALNILENFDLKSMGYNSARYIHTVYQAMNLAFADRDFYYGDPYFPPEEPIKGLLSKDYAKARAALINPDMNDPARQARAIRIRSRASTNPWLKPAPQTDERGRRHSTRRAFAAATDPVTGSFYRGTTSVVAADKEGWVVSMTPERRLAAGRHRRAHRHRHEPAHADLRARRRRESRSTSSSPASARA